METDQDFEDMLELFHRHRVEPLIIGGLAFIYHAKPSYTKGMDLWVSPSEENVQLANLALAEFGSPTLLEVNEPDQGLQIGVAPDRIDLIVRVGDLDFRSVWEKRIPGRYGISEACWIDLDTLIDIKWNIDHPRHSEDARVLMEVRRSQERVPANCSGEVP